MSCADPTLRRPTCDCGDPLRCADLVDYKDTTGCGDPRAVAPAACGDCMACAAVLRA